MTAPSAVGSIPDQDGTPGGAFSLACAPYFDDIDARVASLEWSATALPAGVTMSSVGLLSGTPTTPGTYNIQITVDADDASASITYTRTLIVSTAVSAANVYYIGPGGSDSASGTSWANRWLTITRGCAVAWQTGGVQIQVGPGTYTSQVLAPQNAGNSSTEKIEWTVYTAGGDGVVVIPGPPTPDWYPYGMNFAVANIKVTRANAASYYEVDGGVQFGTSGGQIAAGDDPNTVDRIRNGVYIDAANIEVDINVRRTAGWSGFGFGPNANNWNINCNFTQHGTADIGGGQDSGDMTFVPLSFAGQAT